MKHKWILPPQIESKKIGDIDFHPVLIAVLSQRGIQTKEAILAFLDKSLKGLYDPHKLLDIEKAVDRVIIAIQKAERVLIFGDYDVDGMTAIAILVQFFRLVQVKVDFYIPHRFREGYGLSVDGINEAKKKGINLIITVDTGINNHKEIEYANSLGMEVIVTDHHKPPPELPHAYAILNPNRPSCPYPNKHLAGVGVAFKLVHGCLRKLAMDSVTCKNFLKNLLDYVTLGTIADLAYLVDENRKIVANGLKQITQSPFPGIRILVDQLSIGEKPLTAGMIAFRITPKLNASGRTDHGKVSAKLLIEENPADCRSLYSQLEIFNRERQAIEENDLKTTINIIENNKEYLTHSILVVTHPSFHGGVNGIVASRLVERYHLPAIVFSSDGNGNLKGSARSIKGLNILDVIISCGNLCLNFGGHAFAAGVTIELSQFEVFKMAVNDYIRKCYSLDVFEPKFHIDAVLSFSEISPWFISDLKLLEPFGFGNPEPAFLTQGAIIKSAPRELRGKHVKFLLSHENQEFEVIGFNQSKKVIPYLKAYDKIDIIYRVGMNNWLGQERIQLELIDFRKN